MLRVLDWDMLLNFNMAIVRFILLALFIWNSLPGMAQCKSDFSWSAYQHVVTFQNKSLGLGYGITCYWNFGDGNYAHQNHPKHAYKKAGKYIVYLYIKDTINHNCSDIYYDTIETQVNGPNCRAAFDYTLTGDSIFLNNLSTGIDSASTFLWEFGDGFTSTETAPIHHFKKTGYRKISLKIMGTSCQDTVSQMAFIQPKFPATAYFTYQQTGEHVTFQMDTINPYILIYWQFGNGQSSTSRKPQMSYSANGKYQVCLMVEDTVSGLKDQYCDSVFVSSLPICRAALSYTIFDKQVTFTSLSTGEPNHFFWEFGDNKGGVSWKQHPAYTYDDYGIYKVRLWIGKGDTVFECTDDEIQYIKVEKPRNYFSIQGTLTTDTSVLDTGKVVLYAIDTLNNTASVADSAFVDMNANGFYSFSNVPKGVYKIQAIPAKGGISYKYILPTYGGNQIIWEKAQTIHLEKDYYGYDINLYMFENKGLGGAGRISGCALQEQGRDPVSGFAIYLTDFSGSPIIYILTDSVGRFKILDIPKGKYYLYGESPMRKSSPVLFEIDHGQLHYDSIKLCINSTSIFACKPISISGDLDWHSSFSFFPNPADQNIWIDTYKQSSEPIVIHDLSGKVLKSMDYRDLSMIHIGDLPSGLYIIRWGVYQQKLLISHP